MVRVSWDQVFAWRLRRQFVEPHADGGAVQVAERLCGVQAQVTSAAELAVALRQRVPEPGAVVSALNEGRLIKTWAMRGTLHAMTPHLAVAYLSLIASARTWEKPVWQRNFGATPGQVSALADAVRELLAATELTREELVTVLAAEPDFAGLAEQLRSGWGALLKPLAWQGALCHGPARGNKITFTSPARMVAEWPVLPDPDQAAATAITAYLGAYGPATPEAFDAWLTRGAHRKTTVRRWFAELGDALTEVEVEGRRGYLCSEHVAELAAAEPERSVHLLGGFDQYVLGPGTGDTELLPAAHRSAVSRTAGWIAPIVVVDGRIAGTWELSGESVVVDMFDPSAQPGADLIAAVERTSAAIGADIRLVRAE
ncbi:hypothetical protein B0T36_07180 [Nocardia donostiensis]|nr:hypothetical protein B0T36_07180 [Nocardia donostiensis]